MNPSEQIDRQIKNLGGWCGELMAKLRKIIHEADPEIEEEWKWSTAVVTHSGIVCALGAFKDHIKINFFKGASLKDPHKLFNAGLEAKTSRAIDIFEGDEVNESVLKNLIREAVDYNEKSLNKTDSSVYA